MNGNLLGAALVTVAAPLVAAAATSLGAGRARPRRLAVAAICTSLASSIAISFLWSRTDGTPLAFGDRLGGGAVLFIDGITAGSSAYAESRSLLGLIFKNAGRPDLALEAFDAAIAADPALVAARHNRANLHLQARRFSLAVADFDAVLARAPGTSWERGLRLYAAMHVYDWRDFDAQRRRILDELARGLPSAQPLIVASLCITAGGLVFLLLFKPKYVMDTPAGTAPAGAGH